MALNKNTLWFGLLGLGILAGLITAFNLFITNGLVIYAKTDVLVWTLPLASYVFFSLTSSGIAFVSSVPAVLGIRRVEPLEKRIAFLEITVLLAALSCLMLHLGSPWNAIYFILSPNPASPLWWLGILYGLYLFILLISFLFLYLTEKMSRVLGIMVFFIAVVTVIMLAWLFAMTPARAIFNFPFLAIYFPLSALACGLASILLITAVPDYFGGYELREEVINAYNGLANLFGVVVAAVLLLFLGRTIIFGIFRSGLEFEAFRHMLFSASYNIQLWVGLVAPLVLMAIRPIRKRIEGKMAASAFLLIGMLFSRLEFILSGEILPYGQMAEGQSRFVSYTPNIWELFVPAFGLSVLLLLYTLGERYLDMEPPLLRRRD